MVKKLSIFLGYFVFFLFVLALFIPKSSVYFLLEQELAKNKIIISNEQVVDKLFTLKLQDAQVSYDGLEAARVKEIDFRLLGLYNSINLNDIELSSLVSSFVPSHIKNIHLRYSLLSPLSLHGKASGDFGDVEFEVSVQNMAVQMHMKASELMKKEYKNTLRELKKEENGEYSYANTFQF